MRFEKGRGLTPSEQILADLCEQSFLQLWTYPNLYTKPNKELTDLLVVFDDDIVLFSDKSCRYLDSGDRELDWKRWFRNSILESSDQIFQAERSLKLQPDRVFLDRRATRPLPLSLPPKDRIRFHHVCVVMNARSRCLAETGAPNLSIDTRLFQAVSPFTVGGVSERDRVVHVFDEETIRVVMTQLDTVRDFVGYLTAKEELIRRGSLIRARSELDLLAWFLANEHSFPLDLPPVDLDQNLWEQLTNLPQYHEGRRRDRLSYYWDNLLAKLIQNYIDEDLVLGNQLELEQFERVARVMASESRFNRRFLSQAILERAERARLDPLASLLPSDNPDVHYVILILQGPQNESQDDYRNHRMRELIERCYAAKIARPIFRYFIGIALDARGVRPTSEDFLYIDTDAWNEQDFAYANEIRRGRNFFANNMVESRHVDDEFPIG